MPLTMTRELATAVDAGPARVVHPDTGAEYVLVPTADYDAVREAVEEEKFLRALAAASARAMGERLRDEPWPQ